MQFRLWTLVIVAPLVAALTVVVGGFVWGIPVLRSLTLAFVVMLTFFAILASAPDLLEKRGLPAELAAVAGVVLAFLASAAIVWAMALAVARFGG
jgi:hypothetical protein